MSRFKRQVYEIKEASEAYRKGEIGMGPRQDISGYLSELDGYKRIQIYRPDVCGNVYPLQTIILCYALALEHQRNAKLRRKLHEYKQYRRAEANKLLRENLKLWAENTHADFMNIVKGGLCHGNQNEKES